MDFSVNFSGNSSGNFSGSFSGNFSGDFLGNFCPEGTPPFAGSGGCFYGLVRVGHTIYI